ncbi:CRISPR-associated helicase Cas3' [Clostridium sp. D2Q-14]|uniref:CRISPR-associated helicase Cas3' n=1 Tax=Anaeromonas gelatinilytica TaxID=2683194 RepID=UPI00193BE82A|nr:CRISPR-associated helicase Cas3' [Anaeromonas gelatinilytica]MBS4534394.1 CRISPR-associated helicase Cas3' [Anaeromonas gelatinilytica]
MNNYLAKSNPRETIIDHTEKLIDNYDLLKKTYPDLDVDWDMLYLSCLYHDLGKMNRKFQDKIERIKKHTDEIPHGILSLSFINAKDLKKQGYTKERIKLLAQAIAYHHERDFKFDQETLNREIELLREEANNFNYERLDNILVKKLSKKYFSMDRTYEDDLGDYGINNLFFNYIMIKGLLNRLDYAASGGIDVEKKNDFMLKSLNQNLLEGFRVDNPDADWNSLQKYMVKNRNNNIIVVAQTGMGKTEAGLLWIGNNKGFFTLPLKTAINAMYKRITEKIVIDDYQNKVGLLHSDIKKEYLSRKEEIDFDEYYNKTKQLSLPLTVCTMDQIFDFVYRYRGFEPKLATLAYSKIVIDEVQMYAPDLLAYLVVGLSYIDKIGGKFAVLTATLPQIFVDLLRKEGVEFLKPEPFTNKRIRHSIKVKHEKLNSEFVKEVYKNNKILVICNTVKEAQRIYDELSADESLLENIRLFHSGFIKSDRKIKEEKILDFGNKDNKEYEGIWITTQVVEASLDIDFDILVTELSDLNGLFQRLGRCYRSRDWDKEGYNCYVFDGGDYKCNGVGNFIDEHIFNLSKNALKSIDGDITEDEKIMLIDSIYTIEKLKGTEYYEKIMNAIEFVKLIESYEKSASEIKKIFRNIESKTVIPEPIYEKNKEVIEGYIEILSQGYDKDMTKKERKELKEEKLEARIYLDNFTLNIPLYKADKNLLKRININKYEFIEIFECEYKEEVGIRYKSKEERNESKSTNAEDRMF